MSNNLQSNRYHYHKKLHHYLQILFKIFFQRSIGKTNNILSTRHLIVLFDPKHKTILVEFVDYLLKHCKHFFLYPQKLIPAHSSARINSANLIHFSSLNMYIISFFYLVFNVFLIPTNKKNYFINLIFNIICKTADCGMVDPQKMFPVHKFHL